MARACNFDFFDIRVCYEKLGHTLKPLEAKLRSDLSVRLRDIAENRVPAKLKPIVCLSQGSLCVNTAALLVTWLFGKRRASQFLAAQRHHLLL